jgi:CheY-like chemotaxis protein
LVVEDDANIREALRLLLEEEGYDVLEATSLDAALAIVENATVQLILTDSLAARTSDKLTAAGLLRQRAFPTPVGVLTGWPVDQESVNNLDLAFVLGKPFDLDDLLARVANTLHLTLSPEQEAQAHVVRQYFAALTAGDWNALAALCTEDVTYTLPGKTVFATTLQGRDRVCAYAKGIFEQFPEARFEDILVSATPLGMAARYRGTWRTRDEAHHTQAGAVVFRFADEQIAQIGVRLNDARLAAITPMA